MDLFRSDEQNLPKQIDIKSIHNQIFLKSIENLRIETNDKIKLKFYENSGFNHASRVIFFSNFK